jgi:hypothetical protein
MATEHPDPERWWQHRRRLAYRALWLAVAETLLLGLVALLNPEAVAALSAAIYSSYTLWSVPIVGYYGNTAVEEWARRGAISQ